MARIKPQARLDRVANIVRIEFANIALIKPAVFEAQRRILIAPGLFD
ncbi:MAG TPA: hypothetical protein VF210_19500 [Pseudomonadales bacterium]